MGLIERLRKAYLIGRKFGTLKYNLFGYENFLIPTAELRVDILHGEQYEDDPLVIRWRMKANELRTKINSVKTPTAFLERLTFYWGAKNPDTVNSL